MKSYREPRGQEPAFQVRYRFLTPAEGGREAPPRQHIRWNFVYGADDPTRQYMIWPEFISAEGATLPEGEVPMTGIADMFLLDPDSGSYHLERIAVGTKGYFAEGAKRVAECEVIAIGSLSK